MSLPQMSLPPCSGWALVCRMSTQIGCLIRYRCRDPTPTLPDYVIPDYIPGLSDDAVITYTHMVFVEQMF
jgi:hypothetical protein